MDPLVAAYAYGNDLSTVSRQATALVLRLWQAVQRGNLSKSWAADLPEAVAIIVAAQTVAAEMADPYLDAVLAEEGPARVAVESFAGQLPGGEPIQAMLYQPVILAKQGIRNGLGAAQVVRQFATWISTGTHTTVADSGRLATTAGMTARPHVSGFYRALRPPSCSRCAVLAGKHYRWNHGFARHRNCDCVHIPVQEADDGLEFNARAAIEAGQVTGLSKADTQAIEEFGADPSQVVNAHSGVYTAGGMTFTSTGTTRRGVAGARLLAREIDRAAGLDISASTYSNFAIDRATVARYAELFRRGKTFTRTTVTGRAQAYAYRFARAPRLTPEQIIANASSRAEAIRLLTNFGYVL